MHILVIIAGVALCIARFWIDPSHASVSGSYQAVAHLFTGGSFGAWLGGRDQTWFWVGAAVSCVEVFAACVTRGHLALSIPATLGALALFFGVLIGVENWRKR